MLSELKNHKRFFIVATIILFLSFALNFFAAVETDKFVNSFKGSVALTNNQIICKGEVHGGFMLTNFNNGGNHTLKSCDPDQLRARSEEHTSELQSLMRIS